MCRIILILSFITSSLLLRAQKENNVWHIGVKSGLDFNLPATQFKNFPNVSINNYSEFFRSSCCDENGNLLFYTKDGVFYNYLHQKIYNSDSILVQTNFSSNVYQIVKHPTKINCYYFISNINKSSYKYLSNKSGIYYSILDMNAENGKGKFIEINSLIDTGYYADITACLSSDMQNTWLILTKPSENKIKIYSLSKNGIKFHIDYNSLIPNLNFIKLNQSGNLLIRREVMANNSNQFNTVLNKF